jgi:hypothetical protein
VLWPGSWRLGGVLRCRGGGVGACLMLDGGLGQRVVYFWMLCMYSLDLDDTFVLLYE